MQILYHTDSEGNLTGTTMDQEYKDHVDGMQRAKDTVAMVLALGFVGLAVLGTVIFLFLSWLIAVLT